MTDYQVQGALHAMNYAPGEVDGMIGENTEAAIVRAQSGYGIVVDGIAGADTQSHLAAQLQGIQSKLLEKGFYKGAIDGLWGPQTDSAIMEFQAACGLAVDGIVGQATEAALFGRGSSPEPVTLKNFGPDEFCCECGCGGDIKMELKVLIQRLRDRLGDPIVITSGYRCSAQNARDGGVPDSLHLDGEACDLYCSGHSVDEVANAALSVGIPGVIRYYTSRFVHVQLWPRDSVGD